MKIQAYGRTSFSADLEPPQPKRGGERGSRPPKLRNATHYALFHSESVLLCSGCPFLQVVRPFSQCLPFSIVGLPLLCGKREFSSDTVLVVANWLGRPGTRWNSTEETGEVFTKNDNRRTWARDESSDECELFQIVVTHAGTVLSCFALFAICKPTVQNVQNFP